MRRLKLTSKTPPQQKILLLKQKLECWDNCSLDEWSNIEKFSNIDSNLSNIPNLFIWNEYLERAKESQVENFGNF